MADDYLGKKMEDYRSGANLRRNVRLTPSGRRPGTLYVKFPPRRAFVTGGASGIGREIVRSLADSGCRVAFCDVDSAAGTATAQATGSRFIPVDVRDSSALDSAMAGVMQLWDGLDIVVNNVGIGGFKPLVESTIEDFDNVLATNLRPVYVTSRRMALYRSALAEIPEYGRIVNIASTRAFMSEPGSEGYAASKGGIVALTHALAASFSPLRVTVNCIAPGWIEVGDYSALRPVDHEFHFSGRVGRPSDIASAVLWLCAPDSDFVNGQTITIDGGVTRKMIYPE